MPHYNPTITYCCFMLHIEHAHCRQLQFISHSVRSIFLHFTIVILSAIKVEYFKQDILFGVNYPLLTIFSIYSYQGNYVVGK
jgi:hypothetical protein